MLAAQQYSTDRRCVIPLPCGEKKVISPSLRRKRGLGL